MRIDRDELETKFRAYYEALRPTERRELILFRPAYREHYNRIVQPDEVLHAAPPAYFFDHWFRILKPTCAALYIFVRRIAFANKNRPEDTWCFPDQAELAQMLGISDRTTVRKHLTTLEEFGFLKREQEYRPNPSRVDGQQLWQKSTCRYLCFYEIPVIDQDAVRLMLLEAANPSYPQGLDHKAGNPPYGQENPPSHKVGNPPYDEDFPSRRLHREGFSASKQENPPSTLTLDNVSNINVRVSEKNTRTKTPEAEAKGIEWLEDSLPAKAGQGTHRRERREDLVKEIAMTLNGCKGDHGNSDHQSTGFFRRIVDHLPPEFIHEALRAVKDAAYEAKTGQKSIGSPERYFAGVIRKIAEREGVNLGIQWKS